jgi:hypothetical protein
MKEFQRKVHPICREQFHRQLESVCPAPFHEFEVTARWQL